MPSFLLPLALYAFVMSITPGPNNVMLAASGAAYGMRRTAPHMLGIWVGFGAIVFISALGMGELLLSLPFLIPALKVAASLYLLYLAYLIARAGNPKIEARHPPKGFTGAALFQFINPKGWTGAITAVTAFQDSAIGLIPQASTKAAICTAAAIPCALAWAGFGTVIGHILSEPRAILIFNASMAALTVATAVLVLY